MIFYVDFEDSFSHNILAECWKVGLKPQFLSSKKLSWDKPGVYLYGPGPGHPHDYTDFLTRLKTHLQSPQFFHFGFCLGHQLLSLAHGHEVQKSWHPVHGQTEELTIPFWEEFPVGVQGKKVKVQRYNSLTVNPPNKLLDCCLFESGEVAMMRFQRGLSFQFHPESVGTSHPDFFFKLIKNVAYHMTQKNGVSHAHSYYK